MSALQAHSDEERWRANMAKARYTGVGQRGVTDCDLDLELWRNMETLSRGFCVPSMLVFANDEQVTTAQL